MSSDASTSSAAGNQVGQESGRDEVKEILKLSADETRRIRAWRILVLVLLSITGFIVALLTYTFLVKEQDKNFEQASAQFGRTVGDAIKSEHLRLREACRTLAATITSTAALQNTTWPFYEYPGLEVFADEQVKGKRLESIQVLYRVPNKDRRAYMDMQRRIGERWIKAGHLQYYGNLDFFVESDFPDDIMALGPQGIEPSPIRDEYYSISFRHPPFNSYAPIGLDIRSYPGYTVLFKSLLDLKNETLISNVNPYIAPDEYDREYHERFHSSLGPGDGASYPHSWMYYPVHERLNDSNNSIVAISYVTVAWDSALQNLFNDGVKGLFVVGRNNCNQTFTYEIRGSDAIHLGNTDFHDPAFDEYRVEVDLDFHQNPAFSAAPGHCTYIMSLYPNSVFKDEYRTNTPFIFAITVASTFLVMIVTFFVYDWFVNQRNQKLVLNAARLNEIVSSMFPGEIRDKVFYQGSHAARKHASQRDVASQLRALRRGNRAIEYSRCLDSEPLAKLYMETSIVFTDVVGFTAWSSARDPPQVFKFLETVYNAFDRVARTHGVFKVETVGDCYVAVAGVPEAQPDHAIRICRFADECKKVFDATVRKLEVTFGPDTADLDVRTGIHSGQITAGVLRGDRSRFQLFGDTINTTARLESTGRPGRIQVSTETAKFLIKAGKSDWLYKREDVVHAKGKGALETYWISIDELPRLSTRSLIDDVPEQMMHRQERLVEWNVASLIYFLKHVVARRSALSEPRAESVSLDENAWQSSPSCRHEVKDIIRLPDFPYAAIDLGEAQVEVGGIVENELQDYVQCIAAMYQNNPFHNFEHASHMTMSVKKLLSRIVDPSDPELERSKVAEALDSSKKRAMAIHDRSYGIASDPLTQFACALCALVHDADHTGVPNHILVKENPALAVQYGKQSVAEQNSLTLSWNLLMDTRFKNLRAALCATPEELIRFRALLVNGIIATDVVDVELKAQRNAQWDTAFDNPDPNENLRDLTDRKATVVIELLIQASDIAHTMQHWHVYRKWNERLFAEMTLAYKQGRSWKDPAVFWYQGELDFFDSYVIPLAKKMKDCGVFGASSDEYLNYATKNRQEWQGRGPEVVAEMLLAMEKN